MYGGGTYSGVGRELLTASQHQRSKAQVFFPFFFFCEGLETQVKYSRPRAMSHGPWMSASEKSLHPGWIYACSPVSDLPAGN